MISESIRVKKNETVDVITPTLNAEKFIEQCLLSTKRLRGSLFNHLIVDSSSVDETRAIANAHQVNSIYCLPGNMYKAINYGISKTESDWVTYINSDDMLYCDAIMSALEEDCDDCDVIYGNIDYINSDGMFLHHWRSATPKMLGGLFANSIMPISQPGTLFRRSLWEKLGGFREKYKYSADFDFFLRAFASGARFRYFDKKPFAAFRIHDEQISNNYSEAMYAESRHAISDTRLQISDFEMRFTKFLMRRRNINSYLVRFLRHQHLYQRLYLSKTISIS